MSTHFIDLEALNNYSQKSRDFLEWIVENYHDENHDFTVEYIRRLEELHQLNKSI